MVNYPRFEVHSHTDFSNLRLLDCINKPKKLIDRAIELGLSGIAITDHECLSAAPTINKYQYEILENNPNFKIAIGNEIYLVDERNMNQEYYHFILIAKDKTGFRMLRELSSNSWLQSYVDRGMERVPTLKSELLDIINKYGKGHLIATTACLGGELSTLTKELVEKEFYGRNSYETKEKIQRFMIDCISMFGPDFYVECAPGLSEEQIAVNKRIVDIADAFNVKMVIGTDAHFLTKEDRFVHKAYLNSKDGEREIDSFYEFSYLQSEEEIIENLKPSNLDYATLAANSIEIYDKIEVYSIAHSQQIPEVDVPDYPKKIWEFENKYPTLKEMFHSDDIVNRYWVNQCVDKLKEKNKYETKYFDVLEEEADTKKYIGERLHSNMFAYPVTLQHYIDMFWECGSLVGAGRGSSCAGLNHYLLGVTQLDPVKWELPWFRYLNKERVELPDIDLDLCPSKRPLILEKIKEERGQKFIPGVNDLARKNLGCTLIATFGTEATKSAVQTACRGYRSEAYPDGIDVDQSQYLSSLIPSERGFVWTLEEVVYGDPSKDRAPITTFIKEVEQYPGLLDIMFGIEGLIKQRGSHASGVILFNKDPYEFGSFMKTPNGEVITRFDLHDDEYLGMTKFDFLVTDVQDKLAQTIELLQKDNLIEQELTLREVYDKYFHPEVLPIDDEEIWKALEDGKVINVFQFDSRVGSQAAKKIKPKNMLELADSNGLMRLMTAEKGEETPMDKYVRFKSDINRWYKEMNDFGLTKEEQRVVEPYFKSSYGVPPSQEQLMRMLMDENICNFTLAEANNARKIVGKKQMSKIPELQQKVLEQAKSPLLGQYIWKYGVGPQMGYSFSIIHALAYSFIGFQTLYIATKFNPIYWDTACLVVNSGSIDPDAGGQTQYSKVAKAIGDIINVGIKVSLADINRSDFGFKPDPENNQILFGLKGLLNVGDDLIVSIINNRPYKSPRDFLNKVNPNKQAMVSLIKSGAFDTMYDRKFTMAWYIWTTCDKKNKLNLQNMNGLIEYDLIPTNESEELTLALRVYEFNRYLKAICKYQKDYKVDTRALNFLAELGLESFVDDNYIMKATNWDRKYQNYMNTMRTWIKENQVSILEKLNTAIFKEDWEKYANGNLSSWEMEVMCFYYHEHELAHIRKDKYDLIDFHNLPTQPTYGKSSYWRGKEIKRYNLSKIYGTCIAKDKIRSTVSLLTPTGVVNVKFRKEYFALFDKQISIKMPDGKKKVVEKSWFNRGNMLIIQGMRAEDTFIAKKYSGLGSHQLYKITEIDKNGNISLQTERFQGGVEEDEM